MKKDNILTRYPIIKHLLLMLVVSIAILIIVFICIKIYARQGKEYQLPDMEGQELAEMEANDSIGIKFVVLDSIYQAGEDGGRIITQDPKGGTLIKKGRKIYLTITAFSEDDAIVPEVSDLSLRTAISRLANEGLQGGTVRFIDSPYPTVHDMSYKGKMVYAGQALPRNSMVDLTVGKGKDPAANYTTVPFLMGKTAAKARRELLSSSLNVGREHFGGVKDKLHAVVYQQEPDFTGISRYPYGTEVELWYKDASEVDVEKMVRDFKVDSTKIVNTPEDELVPEDEDFILENEGWTW